MKGVRFLCCCCFTQVIRTGLGSIPFVKDKDEKDDADEVEEVPTPAMPASNRPAVLPDGSYATQVRHWLVGTQSVCWQQASSSLHWTNLLQAS